MSSTGFFKVDSERVRPELFDLIAQEISMVEAELGRVIRSQVKLVTEVSTHILEAGGKRLRPAFVTLAARSTDLPFDIDRARKLGACMEMIHMATLIHDDVIDHSPTRRGKPTANSVFGNTASILSGDVLLSKAMTILAIDGDLEIIRTVSSSVVELAEGEVRELETRGIFDLPEEEHFEILRMKTASFIQCCCEAGALVAGAPDEVRFALGRYGHHVGLAFQIIDDLLDYRGDKALTGKTLATDFREGCATLPLIYLSEKLSEEEKSVARHKFGNGVTDDEVRMICNWMDSRGAFDRAMATAHLHASLALEALNVLPDSPDRALLETVAEFVVSRKA